MKTMMFYAKFTGILEFWSNSSGTQRRHRLPIFDLMRLLVEGASAIEFTDNVIRDKI
jgi:hypothetical protein